MPPRTPLFCLLALGTPAAAQTVTVKPLVDARLRYEAVEQAGLPEDADAVTVRLRAGAEATLQRWSAVVEAQGTLAVVDRYDDGLHGPATRPLVADPENAALHRLQLGYRSPALGVTVGRQRIMLDDERFVGSVGFRQNAQSFDAARVQLAPLARVKLDLSYSRAVRTIWGVEGRGARDAGISGNSVFANAAWTNPLGTLTGFAYLVDEDDAQVQGYRLSSQTYGVRLAGTRPIGGAKLTYAASIARQSDYARNPNRYAATYWLADAAIDLGGPRLGAGYEVLGASRGAPLTSVQTPFGTNFKFQGWADRFLTTPPDGVRDLYAAAGWSRPALGGLKAVSLQATYHRFASDRLARRYGTEWDLLAAAKLGPTLASVRFADYRAAGFSTDIRKLWLQLDWTV